MDSFVNERDFALLARDGYTFSVLDRILRGKCDWVRSDHRDLILCHSEAPYPVWVWTRDGCDTEIMEEAWSIIAANRPLTAGYRFNMKYDLAAYFMEKVKQMHLNAGIAMNLLAYDCPLPIRPEHAVDGKLHCCTEEDAEQAAEMIFAFYAAIGEEMLTHERCTEKAKAYIDGQAFFFWVNATGVPVACCSYKRNQGLASLGSVYTRPEYRRMHYAQQLVYQVTEIVRGKRYLPMLYTDADYPASNACYEKVGYRLRGRLCTVSLRK